MPYSLALVEEKDSKTLFYIDTTVDFLFLIDILVNFNTPVQKEENFIDYNRKLVTLSYLKSWFCIDLLASIPVNFILK